MILIPPPGMRKLVLKAALLAVLLLTSCTMPMTQGLTKDGLELKQVFSPGLTVLPADVNLVNDKGVGSNELFKDDSVAIYAIRSANNGSESDSEVRLWGYRGAWTVAREKNYRYIAILYGDTKTQISYEYSSNGMGGGTSSARYKVDYHSFALMFNDRALIGKIYENYHTLGVWNVAKLDYSKCIYTDAKKNLLLQIAAVFGALIVIATSR